jgi:hypothetical protein
MGGILFGLEKEMPASKIVVFSFQKAKEMAKKELGNIEGQIEDCMQLDNNEGAITRVAMQT